MASALVPFQRSNSSVPSSSSSFHTCPRQWTFDVFLSFRGEDTRDNFISHLYKELNRKGINTFKDDEKLKTGKEISPELLKAIEESRFSIVVISIRYASSSWCLDELVKILECKNTRGQEVYPVFFHVDPSEVRKQTGTFGEGFDELLLKHEIAKVESWRKALNEVGNLSGLAYPDAKFGSESKLIEEIVGKFFYYSNHVYTSVDEGLVGIEDRVEKVLELLVFGKNDSRVIGIWGMGGIGKTTIAKVVYNRISWQFDSCCFIDNVRAVSKKDDGVKILQEQLISEILKEKDWKVSSISSEKSIIKRILSGKKVLIVLDDVDESIELEDLLGEHEWFSCGSRIIITTRDLRVLDKCKCDAKHTYKVEELKKNEAVKLFKSKAFRKDKQIRGYEYLLDCAVEYCRGLPLALKVLGCHLYNRKKNHWKDALNRLECTLFKVEEVLKISYDSLELQEKKIFLDIACFIKNNYFGIKSLISLGFQPSVGIDLLREKSLITGSGHEIVMHDLIREMGRNIVLQESPEPGQRSRLWLYEDIEHVLMNDMGTEKVEGIVMKDRYLRSQDPKKLKLSSKAFAKLRNLRILKIDCFHLSEDFNYLPNNLRYLDWYGYPLTCMPSKFQPIHLVELHMNNSNIEQLWMGTEVLYNLRSMSFSGSKYLTMSPNFETVPNLEKLDLSYCTSLVNLHPSIGSLRRLFNLQLGGCKNIEGIPNNIGQLKALEFLDLYSNTKLQELPEEVGDLDRLQSLLATYTKIRQLPSSICRLSSLSFLDLSGNNFESLPPSINQLSSLQYLNVSYCKRLQELPELSSNIQSVVANDCESLRTIASPSIYKAIESFSFSVCSKLVENKESNIMTDKFISNQFQGSCNREEKTFQISFPGSDIPKWFNHQRNGSSMCLELPPHWFNSRFLGIAVSFVENIEKRFYTTCAYKFRVHHKTIVIFRWVRSRYIAHGIKFESVGVMYVPRKEIYSRLSSDLLNGGEITFETKKDIGWGWQPLPDWSLEVKKWGVRLVYKEDVEGNNDEALTIYNSSIISSQYDNNLNLVVSQGVEEEDANNAPPLKRRKPPSESGDFQKEDCPKIKRPSPRLEQEFNTRVTPPPNKGARNKMKSSPKRKKIKLMWMSTWHKRMTWIQSNQSCKRMVV